MTALANLVHETSTSTGAGNLTLNSVLGKQTFNEAFGTGGTDRFFYFISNLEADEWEVGTGHLSDATTLVRDTVINSSNSDAAVTFSAGLKIIANDRPASLQDFGFAGDSGTGTVDLDSQSLTIATSNDSLATSASGQTLTIALADVLEDLDTLGPVASDGEFIVGTAAGTFAYESGATARTSLGLGTGDSPQFTNEVLTGYQDFTEISAPSAPGANVSRVWAEDNNGISVLHWKSDLGIDHQLGRDLLAVVRNDTGVTLTTGQAVYISGSNGTTPRVSLARADSASTMPALGIVVADISTNGFGQVCFAGDVRGLDTSAWSAGDVLYVDTSTAGALTNTPPSGVSIPQRIGVVVTSNPSQGIINVVVGTEINPGLAQTLTNKSISLTTNVLTGTAAEFDAALQSDTFVFTSEIGSVVQAYSANLTTWAGIAPSANGQSLVAAADYAAMRGLLDLEAGTDFYSISAADSAIAAAVANYTLTTDLAATTTGKGASLIGIEDAGGLITATTVEGALAENRTAIDAIEADYLTSASIGVSVQALDADLTAIAALTTATYGRSLLTLANTAALTAEIDDFVGDSGAGGTSGGVPAPASGDAAANKFLKADGTWTAPSGSGNVSNTGTPADSQLAVWTNSTTIEGDAALTFDTTTDTLSTVNIALTGTLTGASNFSGSDASIITGTAGTSGYIAAWNADGDIVDGGSIPFSRGCRMDQGTLQNINNASLTAIVYDTETLDTDGFIDLASDTNRITIPSNVSKVIVFSAMGYTSGSTTKFNSFMQIEHRNSGGTLLYTYIGGVNYNNNAAGSYMSAPIDVSSGDYFEIFAYQDHGSTRTTDVSNKPQYFGCAVVGD